MADFKYPFTPKSNAYLKPGQFWPIQLLNGHFGCGIVLDVPHNQLNNNKRMVHVGLLNWTNSSRPTVQELESIPLTILDHGQAHIKTISTQDEEISGIINLDKNNLIIEPVVDSRQYSPSSQVLIGYQVLRKATIQDHENLKTKSTWGYSFIVNLANKLLIK